MSPLTPPIFQLIKNIVTDRCFLLSRYTLLDWGFIHWISSFEPWVSSVKAAFVVKRKSQYENYGAPRSSMPLDLNSSNHVFHLTKRWLKGETTKEQLKEVQKSIRKEELESLEMALSSWLNAVIVSKGMATKSVIYFNILYFISPLTGWSATKHAML